MAAVFDATAGAEGWDVIIDGTGFTGPDANAATIALENVSLEVGGTAAGDT
jgi:hypothetical protein